MKKCKVILRSVYYRIRSLIEPPKNKWKKAKLIKYLEAGYQKIHGRRLDIEKPIFFTEKLQWYKVNYRTDAMERSVDKYLFKDYIIEKLGEGFVVPYYGAWTSVRLLKKDYDNLPNTFVLKSTLQSDGNNIKIIKDKTLVDKKALFKELKSWLKVKNTLINSYCSAYYNATPRVIAEQYVEWIGDQLYDYKFFCFKGKPYCAYAAMDHFKGGENSEDYSISFYDMEWNKLDVRYGKHNNDSIPQPVHLKEMIDICKVLSEDFPFVRVDFFDTDDKVYVAELTFYPGGGNVPYDPVDFDKLLGEQFELPKTNI